MADITLGINSKDQFIRRVVRVLFYESLSVCKDFLIMLLKFPKHFVSLLITHPVVKHLTLYTSDKIYCKILRQKRNNWKYHIKSILKSFYANISL